MSEIAKRYFNNFPNSNQCHESSDGFLFPDLHHANAYAATLRDNKVKTHNRSDFEESTEGQKAIDVLVDVVKKSLTDGRNTEAKDGKASGKSKRVTEDKTSDAKGGELKATEAATTTETGAADVKPFQCKG